MAKKYKTLRAGMKRSNQTLAARKADTMVRELSSTNATKKATGVAKRELFAEVSEGVTALRAARTGKRTRRSR